MFYKKEMIELHENTFDDSKTFSGKSHRLQRVFEN